MIEDTLLEIVEHAVAKEDFVPCLVAVEVRHLRACQTPQNGQGQTGEEGIIVEGGGGT